MDVENIRLKKSLVLQSFAPLFILLSIRHIRFSLYYQLTCTFFKTWKKDEIVAISKAILNENFGSYFISIIGVVCVLATLIVAVALITYQR